MSISANRLADFDGKSEYILSTGDAAYHASVQKADADYSVQIRRSDDSSELASLSVSNTVFGSFAERTFEVSRSGCRPNDEPACNANLRLHRLTCREPPSKRPT